MRCGIGNEKETRGLRVCRVGAPLQACRGTQCSLDTCSDVVTSGEVDAQRLYLVVGKFFLSLRCEI